MIIIMIILLHSMLLKPRFIIEHFPTGGQMAKQATSLLRDLRKLLSNRWRSKTDLVHLVSSTMEAMVETICLPICFHVGAMLDQITPALTTGARQHKTNTTTYTH